MAALIQAVQDAERLLNSTGACDPAAISGSVQALHDAAGDLSNLKPSQQRELSGRIGAVGVALEQLGIRLMRLLRHEADATPQRIQAAANMASVACAMLSTVATVDVKACCCRREDVHKLGSGAAALVVGAGCRLLGFGMPPDVAVDFARRQLKAMHHLFLLRQDRPGLMAEWAAGALAPAATHAWLRATTTALLGVRMSPGNLAGVEVEALDVHCCVASELLCNPDDWGELWQAVAGDGALGRQLAELLVRRTLPAALQYGLLAAQEGGREVTDAWCNMMAALNCCMSRCLRPPVLAELQRPEGQQLLERVLAHLPVACPPGLGHGGAYWLGAWLAGAQLLHVSQQDLAAAACRAQQGAAAGWVVVRLLPHLVGLLQGLAAAPPGSPAREQLEFLAGVAFHLLRASTTQLGSLGSWRQAADLLAAGAAALRLVPALLRLQVEEPESDGLPMARKFLQFAGFACSSVSWFARLSGIPEELGPLEGNRAGGGGTTSGRFQLSPSLCIVFGDGTARVNVSAEDRAAAAAAAAQLHASYCRFVHWAAAGMPTGQGQDQWRWRGGCVDWEDLAQWALHVLKVLGWAHGATAEGRPQAAQAAAARQLHGAYAAHWEAMRVLASRPAPARLSGPEVADQLEQLIIVAGRGPKALLLKCPSLGGLLKDAALATFGSQDLAPLQRLNWAKQLLAEAGKSTHLAAELLTSGVLAEAVAVPAGRGMESSLRSRHGEDLRKASREVLEHASAAVEALSREAQPLVQGSLGISMSGVSEVTSYQGFEAAASQRQQLHAAADQHAKAVWGADAGEDREARQLLDRLKSSCNSAPFAAAALLEHWAKPEQATAAQLELAAAAASRSCAFLRCTNVAAGGTDAGKSRGSKRCTGCRACWYCGPDCSHADWRADKLGMAVVHRRVCAALGAARQQQCAEQRQQQEQQQSQQANS